MAATAPVPTTVPILLIIPVLTEAFYSDIGATLPAFASFFVSSFLD